MKTFRLKFEDLTYYCNLQSNFLRRLSSDFHIYTSVSQNVHPCVCCILNEVYHGKPKGWPLLTERLKKWFVSTKRSSGKLCKLAFLVWSNKYRNCQILKLFLFCMSTFYQLTGASKSIFGKVKNQIKINKLSSRIKKNCNMWKRI